MFSSRIDVRLVAVFNCLKRDDGQNLVEYALIVALIAFGSVMAMQGLATSMCLTFAAISSDLSTTL